MTKNRPFAPDDFKKGQYLLVEDANQHYYEAVGPTGELIDIPKFLPIGCILEVIAIDFPIISTRVIYANNKTQTGHHIFVLDYRHGYAFKLLSSRFVKSLYPQQSLNTNKEIKIGDIQIVDQGDLENGP